MLTSTITLKQSSERYLSRNVISKITDKDNETNYNNELLNALSISNDYILYYNNIPIGFPIYANEW